MKRFQSDAGRFLYERNSRKKIFWTMKSRKCNALWGVIFFILVLIQVLTLAHLSIGKLVNVTFLRIYRAIKMESKSFCRHRCRVLVWITGCVERSRKNYRMGNAIKSWNFTTGLLMYATGMLFTLWTDLDHPKLFNRF